MANIRLWGIAFLFLTGFFGIIGSSPSPGKVVWFLFWIAAGCALACAAADFIRFMRGDLRD